VGTAVGVICVKAAPACGLENSPFPIDRRTSMSQPHLHLTPEAIYPFDARGIAKRFRHAAIFGALDALRAGETMRFMNDHDPLPLLEQMRARYGEGVDIQYLRREPGEIVIDFLKRS
jgi:uncharacterized protein (DUF2249 family)